MGHVTWLLRLDGSTVPALPFGSAWGDGFRHGGGMLMVNELRCDSCWLLLLLLLLLWLLLLLREINGLGCDLM